MKKLLALLLLACSVQAQVVEIDGHLWEPNPDAPHCEKIEWKQLPWEQMRDACGSSACAIGCTVVSGYSEEQAEKMTVLYGKWSLKQHEYFHIQQRMKHPKRQSNQSEERKAK